MSDDYFANKVAVVTGGASGNGRSLCKELGRRGAAVVVVDINGEKATRVADELTQAGVTASARVLDVADASAVQ